MWLTSASVACCTSELMSAGKRGTSTGSRTRGNFFSASRNSMHSLSVSWPSCAPGGQLLSDRSHHRHETHAG